MSLGRSHSFRGIGASPGIAVGRVVVLERRTLRVPHYEIEPADADHEIARLEQALGVSVGQLAAIRGDLGNESLDHGAILQAHEMMLRDRMLLDEPARLVRAELINAEWAVQRVVATLRASLERHQDAYFRERRSDLDFVADRLVRNLTGQSPDAPMLREVDESSVLVAYDLSPVETVQVAERRVAAFVTELGGKTSHTTIIARSLDVPAVVGAHGVYDSAVHGDAIIVDGSTGTVVLRPTRHQIERAERKRARYAESTLELLEAQALPARTTDGVDILITGNIELPNEVPGIIQRGGEGIGLYRTEFMFLGRTVPPSEDDHYRTYKNVLDEVGQRPVTVRTFDLGGEKAFGVTSPELEANPALGLRAIRYCLAHPAIFEPQLAGALRAGLHGDLRIMLPMVSGIDELLAAREIFDRVKADLESRGVPFRHDVPLGIMIEVPSAVALAADLAESAEFFAVGTNDLMQFLLAVDRSNDRVDYLCEPLHPAVLRTLAAIGKAAHEGSIPASLCGEIAGDPRHTALLIGLGFTQLSMNAGSIPRVKRMVRDLALEDCKRLAEDAVRCRRIQEVRDLVGAFLEAKLPELPDLDTDDTHG